MPSMTDLLTTVQLLHTITLISIVALLRPTRPSKSRRDRTQPQRPIRDFTSRIAASALGRALYDVLSNWLPWI